MIVWLASYPRSGNRMSRRILYETMGLPTYSDDEQTNALPALRPPWALSKYREIDAFLEEAAASAELHLIKTHRLPRDGSPALYIVRDGRKSCLSYQHFHRQNSPAPFPSLLDVVYGLDFYGSWSSHCRAWATRGNVMLLRYEELVHAGPELLNEIARFIGYTGPVAQWVNDFESERQKAPNLVREGRVAWEGSDPLWTPMIDAVFFHLHGHLMVELGYVDEATRVQHCASIPDSWVELIDSSGRHIEELLAAKKVCDERLTVIDGLKKACDERLALINELSAKRATKWGR